MIFNIQKVHGKSNLFPLTRVMWTFSNWKLGLFQVKTPLQSPIETFHKSVNQHKPSQEQSTRACPYSHNRTQFENWLKQIQAIAT